jgi:hypothetical protein
MNKIRRSLYVPALVCVLASSAIAGDMNTPGAPVPPPEPTPTQTQTTQSTNAPSSPTPGVLLDALIAAVTAALSQHP